MQREKGRTEAARNEAKQKAKRLEQTERMAESMHAIEAEKQGPEITIKNEEPRTSKQKARKNRCRS